VSVVHHPSSGRRASDRPTTATLHGRSVALAALLLAVLSSCSATPVVPTCGRVDAPRSMGPENAFRVSIPAESAPTLSGDRDRMDVAFTFVPPLVGPIVLVKSVGGREAIRWELKVGPGAGISTRCRLGATAALSTCGATIGTLPFSAGGEWSIEPNGNRVLEAGLSFRTCR